MNTWVIGDVQGCYDDLQRLLDKVQFSDSDRLWFAGDLVNRGTQSLATLEFVKYLADRAVCVLGNHDLHLLAAANGARPAGKSDTFGDVLNSPHREELLEWLRLQPLIVSKDQHTMVHAGIYPGWTLSQAHELADEFHAVLHGANYASYFTHMYGNSPAVWDDSLTGYDRLRFIVNAFTRMRFIDHQGALDMAHSGPLGSQPDHLLPWFERANCLPENTQLYFGHWAALQPFDSVHFFALDTGCVWGNALSAIELNSGQRISIPCDGVLRYSAKA